MKLDGKTIAVTGGESRAARAGARLAPRASDRQRQGRTGDGREPALPAQRRSLPRHRDRRIPRDDRPGRAVDDRSYRQHAPRRGFRPALCPHPAGHRARHPSRRRAGAGLERRAARRGVQLYPRQPAFRGREIAVGNAARAGAAAGAATGKRRHARLCRGLVYQGRALFRLDIFSNKS